MTIRDNGRGFDAEAVTPGAGFLFMQDYCGAVGGTLELTSAVGQGTTVNASFSLKSRETSATSPSTTCNEAIAVAQGSRLGSAVPGYLF